ncbi:MAG: phosphoribosylformylglycinamidine cyclo-ligase [Verrucomicrobiota bacterium]
MSKKLTYKESGVDIQAAAEFVHDIDELRARTEGRRKLFGAFGLFAASYDLSGYQNPVLVTGCDGVGTKLELLLKHDLLETAGKDLVAMSVNDILTTGGDPLLFLDYLGVAKLEKPILTRLVAGMAEYLEECGCILAGGETAEMPGMVPEGLAELAGFCIGAAEKEDLLDPSQIAEGDVLVGFPSDGFHANGWSLIRRVLREKAEAFSDDEIVELLAPTRLYWDVVAAIREIGVRPKGYAHITGGGLPENLERLFPEGLAAELTIPRWEKGAVGKVLSQVDGDDAFWTFNMGIGWVAILPEAEAEKLTHLDPAGRMVGRMVRPSSERPRVAIAIDS